MNNIHQYTIQNDVLYDSQYNDREMSESCQDFMTGCDLVSCMKRWLRSKSCVMEARDNGVAKVVS